MDIAVCIPRESEEEVERLLSVDNLDFLRVESRGADGKLVVEFLIALTPAIVHLIIKLYEARMAANRAIQLKYKGLEVKAVSEKTLLGLIERVETAAKKP